MDERHGYRTDSQYVLTYQADLAPPLIDFAVLLSGRQPPVGRRYLELGFGRGRSLNIHAAACPGDYVGIDFNPAHVREAADLAAASGATARFFEDSFVEFAARETIEPADYIVLHGIWSWAPAQARQAIVDIIERALAPGGVVLISYDALPGAAAKATLRDLLTLSGADPGKALAQAKALKAAEAGFFTAQRRAGTLLDRYLDHEPGFVEHDIFNLTWAASYFADVAGELARAGLDYVGPAHVEERLDARAMTEAQRALLERETTAVGRETVRDFIVYRMFRQDLFGRGVAALSGAEQSVRLRQTEIILTRPPAEAFKAGDGDALRAVVFALARDDCAAQRIDALERDPAIAALPAGALLEAIAVLVSAGCAHPIQPADAVEAASEPCRRLNRQLIALDGRRQVNFLASPLIGGGIAVSREERMAIAAGRPDRIQDARRLILARLRIT